MPVSRFAGLLVLAACQSYAARPLDPQDILRKVEAERTTGELTFAAARERLRTHGPRVREARAEYEAAQAIAAVKTPLPNPTLEFGPTLLDGGRSGAEGALGWTVWLSARRRLADDLNAVRADAARVEAAAVLREEYLGLRREWVACVFALREVKLRAALIALIESRRTALRRGGAATALDESRFALLAGRAELERMGAGQRAVTAQAALAVRLGVRPESVRPDALPGLPGDNPGAAELRDLMLRDLPALARLRARYLVAEKELRLEVAKQYPGLEIALPFEREGGQNKYGLALGIEIPLFDRNQAGIAAARAQRRSVRVHFESAVARTVAGIDAASATLARGRVRWVFARDQIKRRAADLAAAATSALRAGTADAVAYLDAVEAGYEAELDVMASERAWLEAWLDLEAACGAPLLRFPKTRLAEENGS